MQCIRLPLPGNTKFQWQEALSSTVLHQCAPPKSTESIVSIKNLIGT